MRALRSDHLPCEAQLHKKFINFINKAMGSSNDTVRFCANSAISGTRCCRNINNIRCKYDININDCRISACSGAHCIVAKEACYHICTSDDYVKLSNIRSLMSIKDDKYQEVMPVQCR